MVILKPFVLFFSDGWWTIAPMRCWFLLFRLQVKEISDKGIGLENEFPEEDPSNCHGQQHKGDRQENSRQAQGGPSHVGHEEMSSHRRKDVWAGGRELFNSSTLLPHRLEEAKEEPERSSRYQGRSVARKSCRRGRRGSRFSLRERGVFM